MEDYTIARDHVENPVLACRENRYLPQKPIDWGEMEAIVTFLWFSEELFDLRDDYPRAMSDSLAAFIIIF